MKVKLDENLPARARAVVEAAGIDVDTVEEEGLGGSDDGSVGRAATEAGRLLIALDRGFGDVMRHPPGSHSGILMLRVDDQSVATVCAAVLTVIESFDLDTLDGCVAVYRNGALRVRRPTPGGAAVAD